MGRRVAAAVPDGQRITYSRTRPEYLRAIAVAFGIAAGVSGGLGFIAHTVAVSASSNLAGVALPVLGWGTVLGGAAGVGLATAAAVGVFARPRVVLARDSGGTGGDQGFGRLWPGAAPAPDGGDDGRPVAAVNP